MTRKKWEDFCIKYIKENGNQYSVFWATSNKFIANAMDRLIESKKITTMPLHFPLSIVTKYAKEYKPER